jgi:uncharacterized protein YlxP (DUF503 family)
MNAKKITNVYIGVYLVRLEMPWARSLKEKRSLVKPVSEKLKARFPVSVARLGGLDSHDWELLGVTAISSDAEVAYVRDHSYMAQFMPYIKNAGVFGCPSDPGVDTGQFPPALCLNDGNRISTQVCCEHETLWGEG